MATIIQKPGLPEIKDNSEVKSFLNKRGIEYDHWPVPTSSYSLTDKLTLVDEEKETLLKNLDSRFETLKEKEGYQSRDLIVLHPQVPGLRCWPNSIKCIIIPTTKFVILWTVPGFSDSHLRVKSF
jgi:1,2-dihydroxy-3-keto-5-methylthiopentene dioxygenase